MVSSRPVVHVLLAVSQPLVRAQLWRTLTQAPELQVVGSVGTAGSLIAQLASLDPDVVLCDEAILLDPALASLFSRPAGTYRFRVVLLAAGPAPRSHGAVPVSQVLPINLSAPELAAHLVSVPVQAPPPPPVPRPELAARFMHGDGRTRPLDSPQAPRAPTGTGLLGGQTARLPELGHRRADPLQGKPAAWEPLLRADQSLTLRDTATRLVNLEGLEATLRALPAARHAVAVFIVDLSFAAGEIAPSDSPAYLSALRSVSAALQANVRTRDLVCRVDGLTFAVLMPGIPPRSAPSLARRLRNAVATLNLRYSEQAGMPIVALGAGNWAPGASPQQFFQQVWQAMLEERARLRARAS